MKKTVQLLAAGLLGLSLFTLPATAEISAADFSKAMESYLKTDAGMEQIGKAMQAHVSKQQKAQREEQQKAQKRQIDEQFKNPVDVATGGSPVKGNADAPITIVEFSDFECPFCSRGKNTMDEVLKAYPDKVKLVFKNLPLPFHKRAKPAAMAALAAGEQGKFWEMHDALFDNQKKMTDEFFEAKAKEFGLDVAKFKKDMASEKIKNQIEEDTKIARKIGIQGTPGFSVNGVLVKGAYPIDHFKMIIDRWLEKKAA